MGTKDRFPLNLKCPKCGKSGVADAWQYDGWSYQSDRATRISHLPVGFKLVDKDNAVYGLDILCTDCNVSAMGG